MDHAISAPRVFGLAALSNVEGPALPNVEGRGWHAPSRWLDLLAPAPAVADAALLTHAPALAYPAAALQQLRDAAARRFFSGAGDDDTCALVRDRFADQCALIVAAADALTAPRRWDRIDRDTALAGDPALAW